MRRPSIPFFSLFFAVLLFSPTLAWPKDDAPQDKSKGDTLPSAFREMKGPDGAPSTEETDATIKPRPQPADIRTQKPSPAQFYHTTLLPQLDAFTAPPAPGKSERPEDRRRRERVREKVEAIKRDMEQAKTKKDQEGVLARHAPDFTAQFTQPRPSGVSDDTYNRMRNDVADVLNQLGERDSRTYGSSLELSQSVLRDDPDNRDALNSVPVSYLGMGRYDDAVQAASRAAARYQDDERAYTSRALAYYQMKNYTQAMEDAKRAMALNPNNETAFQIAKLSSGRVTTPKELGLDKMQQAAADQVAREYQASLQQRSQVEAAAKTAVPAIAARKPSKPIDRVVDSLNRQASHKIKMGDYHGAIRVTDRAIQRSPDNPEARYMRAAARNMTGEYQKAIADASVALKADPDHTAALDTRAAAYLQIGNFRSALADADRSARLDPANAYAYKNRALAKENLGDLEGMISDYRTAARLGPQFESELREVAAKYDFKLEAPPTPPAFAKRAAPEKKSRRFIVVLVSSLTGGLLIAFGMLHVFTGSRKKLRTLITGLPGAGTETRAALSDSPGLEAGYKVLRTLGNGGMGVVFEAEDKALGRKVAIKKMREEIHENERERARFLQEARIVAALHHPNIVDIHSILEDQGELYLIFEFVEGRTIDQILAKREKLAFNDAQLIMHGVCNALDYSHRKGVIHRDLKPSNIMVTTEGMVKVMDFGIARQAKDAMARSTQTKTVAGTPQYMAPEQEEGVVRKESDVFSLGACLYEMLTGQGPFPAPSTTASKIKKRYTKPSQVREELPAQLDALIDDCLEPDPDKRIGSIAEFRRRLDAIQLPAKA